MANAQINKLFSINSGAELYGIFFRLVQAISILGGVHYLFVVLPLLITMRAIPGMDGALSPLLAGEPLSLCLGSAILAEIALRATEKKKFVGVFLGLILSSAMLLSAYFLVGLFGFYCFLNPAFQQSYLQNSPEGFQHILSVMGCHWINPSDIR